MKTFALTLTNPEDETDVIHTHVRAATENEARKLARSSYLGYGLTGIHRPVWILLKTWFARLAVVGLTGGVLMGLAVDGLKFFNLFRLPTLVRQVNELDQTVIDAKANADRAKQASQDLTESKTTIEAVGGTTVVRDTLKAIAESKAGRDIAEVLPHIKRVKTSQGDSFALVGEQAHVSLVGNTIFVGPNESTVTAMIDCTDGGLALSCDTYRISLSTKSKELRLTATSKGGSKGIALNPDGGIWIEGDVRINGKKY